MPRRPVRHVPAAFLALLLAPAVALACALHLASSLAKLGPEPAPVDKAVTPIWVGPGYSGSWYDPARAGEGFTLQVNDDGAATVVWFTYAPSGSAARQMWILGQSGRIDADRIVFDEVYTARGARFGAAFDPADVVLSPWGRLEFRFDSCRQGTVSYQGPAAFGSGTHPLVRLTTLGELDCDGARVLNQRGARAASALRNYSGAFVDPSHGGEGWVIEPYSATQAGAYWFTYDGNGEPAWLLGIGTLDGNRLVIDGALRPVGTSFGAGFDPARVERAPWGRIEFEFGSCNAATVRYASSAPGFDSGTLAAQRLTRLASATCLDSIRPARASGTWRDGPTMAVPESEIAVAKRGGHAWAAGGYIGRRTFQTLDLASGQWRTLAALPDGRDHALAIAWHDGVYVFGGNSGQQGDPGASWRYDLASNTWEQLPGIYGVFASGAAELNGFFYLGNDDGAIVQFDPRTRRQRTLPRGGTDLRDHSQLVAYLGELWMLAGREISASGIAMQFQVTIFDPVSETWRRGPSMARAHSGFAAAVVGDQIMAAGGEVTPQGGVIPNLEIIGPGDETWTLGPNLPTPVHGFQGFEHQGEFWTVGGATQALTGSGARGQVQIYRPND